MVTSDKKTDPVKFAAFESIDSASSSLVDLSKDIWDHPESGFREHRTAGITANYLRELGLEEPGLARLIRAGYSLLDLVTFFTAGPKETRAWTVAAGSSAPEAAGVIHTDFQRGFIRAETIAYDDYVTCKGETGAKEAGKLRIEGSDYKVVDGDVFHFRFNV